MVYTWNSELETGHTIIDNQHKQLFAVVNALFDAHRSGKGRQEVERTMDFLLGYTIKHFADEEALQAKHNYPEYGAHKLLHAEFKNVAQKLIKEMPCDGSIDDFIRKVYATVGEWLVNHIRGDDFRMTAYVRSKEQME